MQARAGGWYVGDAHRSIRAISTTSLVTASKWRCGCGTHLVDNVASCCCQSLGITASLEDGVQFKQAPSQHRMQLLVLHMQEGAGRVRGGPKDRLNDMVVCGRCCEVVGV